MAKILLLGPSFFGYRERVGEEFRHMGHDVITIDDRPSESVAFKSFGRVSYRLVDSRIASYARQVERTLAEGRFDFLVYLSDMSFCFTREQLESMRAVSNARFVAGLWDSFGNCQRLDASRDLFDDIYSFEPHDCKVPSKRILYDPWFFSTRLLPSTIPSGANDR